MTVLLQAANGSEVSIILLHDAKARHSAGGKPIALQVADLADEPCFVLWQLNAL